MKKLNILLALALVASIPTANSASIGRSGGSVSFSRAHAATPSAHPAAPAHPSAIGGGGSVGATRPDLVAQVKGQPAAPAKATTPPPAAAPTQAAAPTNTTAATATTSGPSPFWGSFGGSLAGSALGNILTSGHSTPAPTTTVVSSGGAVATPPPAP